MKRVPNTKSELRRVLASKKDKPGKRIELLPDDATPEQVIAKVNEIAEVLNNG